MKTYLRFIILAFIIVLYSSCEDLQKNVKDKAREMQNTAEKEIDEHMQKIDSTINGMDTNIQREIDRQLEKVDTVLNQLQENFQN